MWKTFTLAGSKFPAGGPRIRSRGPSKIKPDPDPPDETLGPLGGPREGGVDEVLDRPDDGSGDGLDSAGLLVLLHLVTEPLGLFDVFFEQQQQVVRKALQDRVAFLGLRGTGP